VAGPGLCVTTCCTGGPPKLPSRCMLLSGKLAAAPPRCAMLCCADRGPHAVPPQRARQEVSAGGRRNCGPAGPAREAVRHQQGVSCLSAAVFQCLLGFTRLAGLHQHCGISRVGGSEGVWGGVAVACWAGQRQHVFCADTHTGPTCQSNNCFLPVSPRDHNIVSLRAPFPHLTPPYVFACALTHCTHTHFVASQFYASATTATT